MTATRKSISVTEAAERLKAESSILVACHEGPDGDALGCISAMLQMAAKLGIEATAWVPSPGELPVDYAWLPLLDKVARGTLPQVGAQTTVYIVDCSSPTREVDVDFAPGAVRVVIDHHQSNDGDAEFNLLDASAPSATTLVYEVFKAGGMPIDAGIATALYVGLVTDTGRFQYSNTTARAHRVAAELQELGVTVNDVYRLVYESTPLPKLQLLQRALCHLDVRLGGALVVSWLGREDFAQAAADEGHAEGIIDTLRKIQGVKVAAIVKEREDGAGTDCKVSLRSTDGTVNVAEIAQKWGGGGHIRAAGFSCTGTPIEIMDWIEQQIEPLL